MLDPILPAGLAAAGLAGLGWEAGRLAALRSRVPLRIAVTGTRGKSTVTRLIAAALRADGRRVLAKTTGSRPILIGPDGLETPIRRPGPPSILEGKSVLRAAARLRADALAAEMMSIGPEALRAEAARILRPHILVVTNARLDHREEMGRTRDAIAATLTRAFTADAEIFIPEEEMLPAFEEAARRTGSRIHPVPGGDPDAIDGLVASRPSEFPVNLRLAAAAARRCGVGEAKIAAGLSAAAPDFGGLAVWRLGVPGLAGPACAASLFAANEPESTALSLARMEGTRPGLPRRRAAVLALRADREDRTRQWIEAARGGFFDGWAGVVAVGDHARPVARLLRRAGAVAAWGPAADPAAVTRQASRLAGGEACLIGMGNIVGAGARLVEFWAAHGEPV